MTKQSKYTKAQSKSNKHKASYDSFAYECAVWLSEILTPLREHPSNIKDTFDFVTRILSSKPAPNHMVSFDVKSLFTNIPIDFVIDQILEKSFPDKKALFHGLTHSQFKKLLIWTTKKKQHYSLTIDTSNKLMALQWGPHLPHCSQTYA